jgi:hypothetical protein
MSIVKYNNEDVIAYYIAEGASISSEPTILKTTKNIIKFEAIIQDCDTLNRNKRIYPRRVLEEGIKSPRLVERFERGGLLSEFCHPKNGSDINRLSDIDLARSCSLIKSYKFEDKLLYGVIETISSPLGNTLKSLILENGYKPSFSLRAFGKLSTQPGKQNVVDGPLNIITWDTVVQPSHSVSVMTKLIENENFNPLVEQIIPITEQQANDFLLENSDVMNILQSYIKDRQKKQTNIDSNGNVTIITEQEKLFVNVEKHVRDKYFKML